MTVPSDSIRIALVGTGPWARNIVRTIGTVDGAALSLVMNQSGASPDFVPGAVPVAAYQPALLDPATVDAVVIATPPHSHAPIATAVLQRRLPVFMEKPLTLSAREAADLLTRHRTAPVPFFVDHIYLFHAGFRALKAALAGAGRIRAIASTGGNRGPFRPDTPMLWDWAPHDIAMCLDLVGQVPTELRCGRVEAGADGQGQRVAFSMDFHGGCRARIDIGNIFPERRRRLTVYTETETLRFEDEGEARVMRFPAAEPFEETGGPGEALAVSGDLPLTRAIAEFCQAVRRDDRDPARLELAVEVVRLIERLDREIAGRG